MLWGGSPTIQGARAFTEFQLGGAAGVTIWEPGITAADLIRDGSSTLTMAGGSVLQTSGDLVVVRL